MGSRLGRRVVNFANLPIKLLMPTTFTNIHEIALKTICSATKIEIKRVLESMYGFEVEKVRTLNMEGRKKKRGGLLVAKPDYKKAFVTLKTPLSISKDLYPIRIVEEDRKNMNKKVKSSIVEEGEKTKHWLEGDGNHKEHARGYVRGTYHKEQGKAYANKHREGLKAFNEWRRGGSSGGSGSGGGGGASAAAAAGSSGGAKFPWSFLKTEK